MSRIRVLLADDHTHIHQAVALTLHQVDDIELVAQCANGEEALALCEQVAPDVILMDVIMPVMDGIEATRLIHEHFPDVRVLVLSSFEDHDSVHNMLGNGAQGYLLKGAIARELCDAIRAIDAGNTVLATSVAQTILEHHVQATIDDTFGLTDRETEVLRAMASGMNNAEIAQSLYISRSTVKFHLANILDKMRVETRAEAIVLAAKSGIV